MKSILMPSGLKIDQVIALAIVLEALKASIEEVQFYFLDLDADAIPEDAFDLDARVKYSHGSSATEEAATRFGKARGIEALRGELSRNNATGFMRQGKDSFAKLAQKLYSLRASTTPEREHRLDVLRRFVWVGQAYLRTVRDGQLGAKAIAKIVQSPGSSKKIHHLSGYISRLVEEGCGEEAVEELKWWWQKFAAAERAEERAEKRVKALGNLPIAQVGGLNVAYIRTQADEVAKAIFARYPELDVLLSVQPSYATILPNYGKRNGGKMRALHKALESREPGAWHFEPRGDTGLVMNGSARRHAAIATKIARDERTLLTLMKEVWG